MRRRRRLSSVLLPVGLAGVLLGAAACGSSGGDSGAAAANSKNTSLDSMTTQELAAQAVIEQARLQGGRRVSGHVEKVRPGGAGRLIVSEARDMQARAIVITLAWSPRSRSVDAASSRHRRMLPRTRSRSPSTQRANRGENDGA